MNLETHTKRLRPNGEPYPRCREVVSSTQCDKPTYADGRCYQHYQLEQRRAARSSS
jgi:hypothetical protein